MIRSLILVLIFLAFSPTPSRAGDADLFPSVTGWQFAPGEKVYSPDNLWDLIDGAAELYLSYGFVTLTLGEYTGPSGIDVRVELYRHNSKVNAFGIYSQERNPDYNFIKVGAQGYVEDGVLNFLNGPFYVKITTHSPGKEGREAMMLVAGKMAEALGQDSTWPRALALLPREGKHPNSENYIAENFLGYSFLHSAYVAEYGKTEKIQVFIIELDNREQARRMASAYLKETHSEGSIPREGRFKIQDPNFGAVYVLLNGKYLCGVVHCGEQKTAGSLLREIQARL